MPLCFFSFAGELIPAWYLVHAALQSAPLYGSCLFTPTSSGDSFDLGGFSPTKFVVQGWLL